MTRFLIRRILLGLLVLWLITVAVFGLFFVAPNNVARTLAGRQATPEVVAQISHRLGLTSHTDPVKIEQDLIPIIPQEDWTLWSHLLIAHGRAICQARKPKCPECPLLQHCPFGQKHA